MTLQELGITYKRIKKKFVGFINFRGEIKDILTEIDEFYQKYKDYIKGPVIAVIDYGVYSEGGKDIDLCFELMDQEIPGTVKTKYLDEIEVLAITHEGPNETLNATFQKISSYLQEHIILGTSWLRLVYHKFSLMNPEKNQIEIQYQLHKWDNRLEKNLDRVLGEKKRKEIMKDRDKLFTIDSSSKNRIDWLKQTLNHIDKLANDNEKYEILSCCAHKFSQKRIDLLRSIYEKNKDVDEVIREMDKDFAWYEGQKRKDNTIFVQKIPYNKEGYEKATIMDEKKQNYCHCPLVKNYLSENISPTFCNCSAGWYRQYWEGILGKSVQINILKSLIKGDEVCQFEIKLPQKY